MIKLGNFFFHYRNALFPAAFILLFVNSPRILPDDTLAAIIGVALAAGGQILRAVTIGLAYIIRGGKKRQVYAKRLVQEGMFAHCRNPLYVGNLLIVTGMTLVANSLLFALIGLPFFLLAYRAIVAAEENFLSQTFGAEFTEYCRRVHRFLPNFSGFAATWRGMDFNWQRIIVKDYGTAYPWMVGVVLLLLKQQWIHAVPFGPSRVALFVVLGVLTLLYGWARYLKKSGILRAD